MNRHQRGRGTPVPEHRAHPLFVYWLALLLSGMAEAIWAGMLDAGVLHPLRATVFAGGLTASLIGLAFAMRVIPMGTAYAIWTGVGAATTAGWSAMIGEPFGPGKIACLALIIAGVAGLQLTAEPRSDSAEQGPAPGRPALDSTGDS